MPFVIREANCSVTLKFALRYVAVFTLKGQDGIAHAAGGYFGRVLRPWRHYWRARLMHSAAGRPAGLAPKPG